MRLGVWRHFDIPLFLIILVLVLVGCLMVYSAYEASRPAVERSLWENVAFRQAFFAGIGLCFYLLMAAIDYRLLVRFWRWGYLAALGLLLLTRAAGSVSFGAQSWLRFEFFNVQASELCKVIMILTLARVLSGDHYDLNGALPLALSIALLVPPLILIYLQPDFGTALILGAIWAGMVVLAGVRWPHLLILGMIGAALAPLIWFRLEPYMQQRILHFFFPDSDPTGASYNVNQALISIGSGGWWGKGLFHGTQSQLQFLRVRHTDFIFSVLAEETGFVGASFLVILFILLILRLMRVARLAPDHDGRLIASGVAVMIFTQTFINIGMNANILPVTGLPLPLVSYGGSALVTLLLALGIVQSVAMRHKPPEEPLLPLGR